MQKAGWRWRPRFARRAAAALCLGLGVVVAVGAEQVESLSQLFESRYQQLVRQVQGGELPPATADQAKAVWLALRKDIIALDAEVETLKLEVMSRQGARQEAALDQVAEKTAQRERRLLSAIQDLDRLAGGAASAIPLVPAAVPAASSTGGTRAHGGNREEKQKEASEETKTRIWDIEIEFTPEDVTKGDLE